MMSLLGMLFRSCSPAGLLFTSVYLLLGAAVGASDLPDYLVDAGRQNQTAIECSNSHSCPISTVCNHQTKRCECASEHLVSVSPYMPCLTRKYLGDSCIVTRQCNHIHQAICVSNSRNRNELRTMPFKDFSVNTRMLKHPEKYLPRNDYGRCECRPGTWANQNHQCVVKRLDSIDCTDSHQCPDQNSRCDFFRKTCVCEFGHKYDSRQDRCLLNVDMFGVFCKEDLDCQARHDQLRCFMGICTCINKNRYDPFRGCGNAPQPCKNGHTWNDFSKSCEPTVYNYHRDLESVLNEGRTRYSFRRWNQMSAEVWFKFFIFILFIVGMAFTLKNRKTCFGGNQRRQANLMPYELNRTPRRSSELPSRVHAVHVRVNLTEYDDMESGALMVSLPNLNNNRRWSLCSNSSLPPYEATSQQPANATVQQATPPPPYDQLPTYEEAISGLAKGDDFCAKDQLSSSTPTLTANRDLSPNSTSTSATSSPTTHAANASSNSNQGREPEGC